MPSSAKQSQPAQEAASRIADQDDLGMGKRLREAREKRDLTQGALSARAKWSDPAGKGISRTAILSYEAGTSRPGAREIRILCKALHVTPNELLFGSESPFEATHVATEGLLSKTQASLHQALQLAFVLGALKGHERDALASLALSLAGRQLGDARLSGLRGVAAMFAQDVGAMLCEKLPSLKGGESLEEIMDQLSKEVATNIGNRLKLSEDDGEVVGGSWEYPEPKRAPKGGADKS